MLTHSSGKPQFFQFDGLDPGIKAFLLSTLERLYKATPLLLLVALCS